MAKKSAIRRLAKRLPMSSDLDDLIRRDDALYDFERKAAIDGDAKPTLSITERLDKIAAKPEEATPVESAPVDDTPHNEDGEVIDESGGEPDVAEQITAEAENALGKAATPKKVDEIVNGLQEALDDLPQEHKDRLGAAVMAARKRINAKIDADANAAKAAEKTKAANGNAAKKETKPTAPPAGDAPELSEELAETGRKKAERGSQILKLWRNALSKENAAAVGRIAQELDEIARKADEAKSKT
jgi:hypothetical protein